MTDTILFPDLSTDWAHHSLHDSIINRDGGWIDIQWQRLSGETIGLVQVCTASDAEMLLREDNGEFPFEVIDEHSTWIRFSDRSGFRVAYGLARAICRNGKGFLGIEPGVETAVQAKSGRTALILEVTASAHHCVHFGEAAPIPECQVKPEQIIRKAAGDLPSKLRVQLLTEILIELDSARAIDLLSAARAAISLRMQELIEERI